MSLLFTLLKLGWLLPVYTAIMAAKAKPTTENIEAAGAAAVTAAVTEFDPNALPAVTKVENAALPAIEAITVAVEQPSTANDEAAAKAAINGALSILAPNADIADIQAAENSLIAAINNSKAKSSTTTATPSAS